MKPSEEGIEESGKGLTPQQEKAVAALLSYATVTKAAEAVGVSETTLWRWQQEPAFKEAYTETRRQSVANAMGLLQKASGAATATLISIMQDDKAPHSVRVNAAGKVLDYALQVVEWEEIELRLEDMEQRLQEQLEMTQRSRR
jgi:hypothetical protein